MNQPILPASATVTRNLRGTPMKVRHGNGKTEYGPGVEIKLTGDEVALAISNSFGYITK